MLAWNDAQVSSSLQVAKALRLELKKTESDASSVLVQASFAAALADDD